MLELQSRRSSWRIRRTALRVGAWATPICADRRVAIDPETPRTVVRQPNANAMSGLDARTVQRAGSKSEIVTGQQLLPVVGAGYAECLPQAARSAGKRDVGDPVTSSTSRNLISGHDPSSAKQDSRGRPVWAGNDVAAPVHPIGQVDIEVASWSVHHGVARRLPSCSMAGRIVLAHVGLHLGEDQTHSSLWSRPAELPAQQCRSSLKRWTRKDPLG